ncbi:type II secretion system protein [Litoribacillus peritrichatus]|uniref:Prepilin-type N-terminal cleavage/methylation domain-containing protein n=1 Tax=Litoribacillus peritrichatus TaxID=718191 RepID=A0ABP7MSR8_9GAMM
MNNASQIQNSYRNNKPSQQGFTLIELIIVITIAGIVAVLAATIMGNQMQAFVDLTRRAELVDNAETAVRQITRDVRHALPNSVRITTNSGNQFLEFVPIIGAGRYRTAVGSGAGETDILDFSTSDSTFQLLGASSAYPTFDSSSRMVVYNIGQKTASGDPVDGANVYGNFVSASGGVPVLNSHVITDAGMSRTDDIVTITGGHQFAFESPQKRFYVVEDATSYICDISNQEILKHDGYSFGATQGDDINSPPLSLAAQKSTLVENVSACSFTYDAGNAQRSGLVTLRITLEDAGERVTLVHQIHVDNAP